MSGPDWKILNLVIEDHFSFISLTTTSVQQINLSSFACRKVGKTSSSKVHPVQVQTASVERESRWFPLFLKLIFLLVMLCPSPKARGVGFCLSSIVKKIPSWNFMQSNVWLHILLDWKNNIFFLHIQSFNHFLSLPSVFGCLTGRKFIFGIKIDSICFKKWVFIYYLSNVPALSLIVYYDPDGTVICSFF